MFHPLIRLLTTQPHLMVRHLGGYADLASAQAGVAAQGLKTRLVWTAATAACGAGAALLSGVALLLVGVLPVADMPAPWLLVVAPALPLAAALACWWRSRRHSVDWSLDLLREQFEADVALLEAAERR